jgi:predicted  nucleic acid-binding Zn-ribbon protein
MSDEPDNLVLRYLRRIDERTGRLETDMQDVKERLSSLSLQVTLARGDITRLEQRMDRGEERFDRIEKRLGLIGT